MKLLFFLISLHLMFQTISSETFDSEKVCHQLFLPTRTRPPPSSTSSTTKVAGGAENYAMCMSFLSDISPTWWLFNPKKIILKIVSKAADLVNNIKDKVVRFLEKELGGPVKKALEECKAKYEKGDVQLKDGVVQAVNNGDKQKAIAAAEEAKAHANECQELLTKVKQQPFIWLENKALDILLALIVGLISRLL